ncbi:hypothetical protein ES705_21925 [subsurface metagenome]
MVREILAYICFVAAAVSFVTMYVIPKIRRLREVSQMKGETQGREARIKHEATP